MAKMVVHSPVLTPVPTRREGVRLYLIDDEAMLYDPAHDVVHYLNATACFIWERCDGRRTAENIAADLRNACGSIDGGLPSLTS